MDARETTEEIVERMEREGCPSNFDDMLIDLLGEQPNVPPSPFPPVGPPAQPAGNNLPGGFGGLTPLGAGPPVFVQQGLPMVAPPTMVPAHLHSQAGTVIQGQNLLHQWPVNGVPTAAAAATIPPAAPSNSCNSVLQIPDYMRQYLHPVGVLNGLMVCDFGASASPLNTPSTKKRKRHEQQEDGARPYVKKPPNAFMLYLKEQRPKVKAELNIRGSAAVNAVVGERWKSLTKAQQAKYYEQANEERMLHAEQHPEWSSKENYGKKRRKARSSACSTASALNPVQEAQQASVPVCGTFYLPQEKQDLPASPALPQQFSSPSFITQTPAMAVTSASPSTQLAAFAGPSEPQNEAASISDTGVSLLAFLEDPDVLLPLTQPQEPFFLPLDSCTGHEISSSAHVDAPLCTLEEEDLLFLNESEEELLFSQF